MHSIKSPLKAWPGEIKLPEPDEFSGADWQVWSKAVNAPKRKAYSNVHLYCYSGLELIQASGEWGLKIPLAEVQAWEHKPEDERIKLMAWLGRTMMLYMDGIIDPKE